MSRSRLPALLLAAALAFGGLPARAASDAARPAGNANGEARSALTVVVLDPADSRGNAFTNFDRLALAFRELARARQWPGPVRLERVAGNVPAADPELRIANQPVRDGRPGEVIYRGWMTLTVAGRKHDFGLVTFRYWPRPGETPEDTLRQVYAGAATAAAEKVEPILFPQLAAAK